MLTISLDPWGGDIEEGEEKYDEEGVAREVWPLLSALRACGGGEGGRDAGEGESGVWRDCDVFVCVCVYVCVCACVCV
jgi:hypothetical protein